FIVGGPVGDFELLLCHGTVCVVGKMRDLILQLSKSSIYSTKPIQTNTGTSSEPLTFGDAKKMASECKYKEEIKAVREKNLTH
ncbi:hypothetical protein J9B11_25305, partial [Klebsiella pneumoniae]